jgi:hypothetical protein
MERKSVLQQTKFSIFFQKIHCSFSKLTGGCSHLLQMQIYCCKYEPRADTNVTVRCYFPSNFIALLEKIRDPQIFNKFPVFYGTPKYITILTRA